MEQNLVENVEKKYEGLNMDPATMMRGLFHSKPLSYWDYVEVDTLLSLQKPRTGFPDEFIFIVYHQVTELVLRLIKHELEQLTSDALLSNEVFAEKLNRICRYVDMLVNSFSVMTRGMDYEQYNQFRLALAPASGFQSVQFREIELYSTNAINLVKHEFKSEIGDDISKAFDYMYWKDAGLDRKTGKKSQTLKQFEEKYMPQLTELALRCKNINLEVSISLRWNDQLPEQVKEALRMYDYMFNVKWPLVHLKTAEAYLIAKGQKTASTGLSDWQKYLHPSYQRRMFFPKLWSDEELKNWGHFELSPKHTL